MMCVCVCVCVCVFERVSEGEREKAVLFDKGEVRLCPHHRAKLERIFKRTSWTSSIPASDINVLTRRIPDPDIQNAPGGGRIRVGGMGDL